MPPRAKLDEISAAMVLFIKETLGCDSITVASPLRVRVRPLRRGVRALIDRRKEQKLSGFQCGEVKINDGRLGLWDNLQNKANRVWEYYDLADPNSPTKLEHWLVDLKQRALVGINEQRYWDPWDHDLLMVRTALNCDSKMIDTPIRVTYDKLKYSYKFLVWCRHLPPASGRFKCAEIEALSDRLILENEPWLQTDQIVILKRADPGHIEELKSRLTLILERMPERRQRLHTDRAAELAADRQRAEQERVEWEQTQQQRERCRREALATERQQKEEQQWAETVEQARIEADIRQAAKREREQEQREFVGVLQLILALSLLTAWIWVITKY